MGSILRNRPVNSQKIKEASEHWDRIFDQEEKMEPDHRNLMDVFDQIWRAVANLEHENGELKKRLDGTGAAVG